MVPHSWCLFVLVLRFAMMLMVEQSSRAIIIDRSQRQIDTTDKQIDQLVYELYGLTDEEIRIVEEATK
ncbi:MAG: hypothetical protein GWP10_21225 [Nitrospiraceae bacterium]|nr:hypothetical protein [Nitrospiraceae bacterium]